MIIYTELLKMIIQKVFNFKGQCIKILMLRELKLVFRIINKLIRGVTLSAFRKPKGHIDMVFNH